MKVRIINDGRDFMKSLGVTLSDSWTYHNFKVGSIVTSTGVQSDLTGSFEFIGLDEDGNEFEQFVPKTCYEILED